MTNAEYALETLKSRASILPTGSTARAIMDAWIATGQFTAVQRNALCFELIVTHGWDVDLATPVLSIATAAIAAAAEQPAPPPPPAPEPPPPAQ